MSSGQRTERRLLAGVFGLEWYSNLDEKMTGRGDFEVLKRNRVDGTHVVFFVQTDQDTLPTRGLDDDDGTETRVPSSSDALKTSKLQ